MWTKILSYIIFEAQTKLVCQQVVQKITTESKHPNIIMSQWQNTTAIHVYAYIQVSSVQQPDSQVNNSVQCVVSIPYATTSCAAFNTFLTIRISEEAADLS